MVSSQYGPYWYPTNRNPTVSYLMKMRLDPGLEAFTGSHTRLATLAALASAPDPMTGYRIAVLTGLPRVKVYQELHRASSAGIVSKDGRGYALVDADLVQLLRKRARMLWLDDWVAEKQRLRPSTLAIAAQLRALPTPRGHTRRALTYRGKPLPIRHASKDRVLQAAGLRGSEHG